MDNSPDQWKLYMLYGSLSGVLFFFSLKAAKRFIKIRSDLKNYGTLPVSYIFEKKHNKDTKIKGPAFKTKPKHMSTMRIFLEGKLVSDQNQLLSMSKTPVLMKINKKSGLNYFGHARNNYFEARVERLPIIQLQDFYSRNKLPLTADSAELLRQQLTESTYHKIVTKDMSLLKSICCGFLSILGLFVGETSFGYLFGYKDQQLTIGLNTPVYMYATVIWNKDGDTMHVQVSNFLTSSITQLKRHVDISTAISTATAIGTAGLTLYFIYKLVRPFMKLISIRNKREKFTGIGRKLKDLSKLSVDEFKCIICFNDVREIILLPCRHVSLCSSCYCEMERTNTMKGKCPMCKTIIQRVVAIHYN